MVGGKNLYLFILLSSYALFGVERHENLCFLPTFGIRALGFLPLSCDVFFFKENNMRND